MRASLLFILSFTFIAVQGCAVQQRDVAHYNEDVEFYEDQDFQNYGNIDAQDGWLAGDIGSMTNLALDANVSGYDEGSYSSIEVLGQNNDGAAMHLLDFIGGIHHPALRPGAEMTFRTGNYPSEGNALHMEVMVCSGDTAYAWDYDEAAEEVHLTVSETDDPQVIQIDYTTQVGSNPSFGLQNPDSSTGRFLLRR